MPTKIIKKILFIMAIIKYIPTIATIVVGQSPTLKRRNT